MFWFLNPTGQIDLEKKRENSSTGINFFCLKYFFLKPVFYSSEVRRWFDLFLFPRISFHYVFLFLQKKTNFQALTKKYLLRFGKLFVPKTITNMFPKITFQMLQIKTIKKLFQIILF
jgi:hypothetical protein